MLWSIDELRKKRNKRPEKESGFHSTYQPKPGLPVEEALDAIKRLIKTVNKVNKSTKVILHCPNRSSSSVALATLKWDSLEERRSLHRSSYEKKTLLNNVKTSNVRDNDLHTFRLPSSRTNWGKQHRHIVVLKS